MIRPLSATPFLYAIGQSFQGFAHSRVRLAQSQSFQERTAQFAIRPYDDADFAFQILARFGNTSGSTIAYGAARFDADQNRRGSAIAVNRSE